MQGSCSTLDYVTHNKPRLFTESKHSGSLCHTLLKDIVSHSNSKHHIKMIFFFCSALPHMLGQVDVHIRRKEAVSPVEDS